MLKRTIEYVDYDGVQRKEDFYFNLSQSEIAKMELSTDGGMVSKIKRVVDSKDGGEIMKMFEELILASYGEKTEDGKHFMKSDEIAKRFSCTPAYDKLFMELCTDPNVGAAFFNGIVPQELLKN